MRVACTFIAAAVLSAGAARADLPEAAVYVTDQNADAFVAIYGQAAVELAGCTGPAEVRRLLQLGETAPIRETTLVELEAGFALGQYPRIPCRGAAFDLDLPATAPIWADLQRSGDYLITTDDGYVAVPAACTGIKAALAIRERLQLPGVLQGMAAPPDLGTPRIRLDCGSADGVTVDGGGTTTAGESAWSLHRFETFLTEESTGDTVLVARYLAPGEGAEPAFLAVYRIDGSEIAALALSPEKIAAAEAAVKALLGITAEAAVTALGAESVAALRSALYADLCTDGCEGYVHAHAAFLEPGIDLGVSQLAPPRTHLALDRFGAETLVWTFAPGREVALAGCPQLAAALGLGAAALGDWFEATAAAIGTPAGSELNCLGSPKSTCVRQIADGQPLTAQSFAPGPDCGSARRLRVELPAFATVDGALVLTGAAFEAIALAPAAGAPRAVLRARPSRPPATASGCVLSPTDVIISASGLPRLELNRVDLGRQAGSGSGEVLALQVQNGTAVLVGATLGGESEGTEAIARGVNLCLGDLYAADARIEATSLAVQALSARVMITGTPAARSTLARARFGLLLSSGSRARLDATDISAATPIVLRGAVLKGGSVALAPLVSNPPSGSALQLERGSTAELLTSTAAGFRCAASFADAASAVDLVLPGNDVAAQNTHLACGLGQIRLIE